MRKLTSNQINILNCLTTEFTKLKEICEKYGEIQGKNGLTSWGYVWKGEVSNCLKSLIVRDLVKYEYRGKYKLKIVQ